METQTAAPWLDQDGKLLSNEQIKTVSKDWTEETWENFLVATVDVELAEEEKLIDDYEELLEDEVEGIWSGPCRVPCVVRKSIEVAIRSLAPQQRQVIRGLFYHSMTGVGVARRLKISPSAVAQAKIISLNKIRSLLESDLNVLSYLIGGSKNFDLPASRDEEIKAVYRADLEGSYLK